MIVRILRASRKESRRGDEAAERKRAALEEIPAAERSVLFFIHRIRSFHTSLYKDIIEAQMHKRNLKIHIFHLCISVLRSHHTYVGRVS